MRHLVRLYDGLIVALAAAAGAMLAGVFVMIVYDVTVRALGHQPPAHTSALSEYAMLYMTLLAAPWVLRKKGHVFVEFLAGSLPGQVRRGLQRSIYVLCIVICLGLAYYGLGAALDYWERGELDIRSIVIAKWAFYAPLPVGFFLCAVEFGRFLIGVDDMYDRGPDIDTEGI